MPPKAKYTREEIIETALNIVAEKGKSALNARDLGAALGTSTRPVFTAFKNMSELIEEVKKAAMKRFESYSRKEAEVPGYIESQYEKSMDTKNYRKRKDKGRLCEIGKKIQLF